MFMQMKHHHCHEKDSRPRRKLTPEEVRLEIMLAIFGVVVAFGSFLGLLALLIYLGTHLK